MVTLAPSRHALGQWFTPPEVADLVLSLAEIGAGARVLDPACGDGVFLERALARGASRVRGIEIDPRAARAARRRVPGAAVEHVDLFDVEPDREEFDAVVGNPPYVRQERLGADAKRAVRNRLARDYPDMSDEALDRLVGRGDLAIACIARALRLVKRGGRVALVVSSALVDAAYAEGLWELVRSHGRIVAIVDAPRERWFSDAAVNAVIVVLERGTPGGCVRIARLTTSTAAAAARVECPGDLEDVADVRIGTQHADWAPLLRAPDAWFRYRDAVGDALVPLGDVASIRRGITSGANDVFYLPRARADELGLERDILLPMVRRPGDRIGVDPDASSHVAVVMPPTATPEDYPAAHAYFDARADAALRPTLRARSPWWALPARPARLFMTKAYNERFVQHFAPRPVVADQRVYAVHPRRDVDVAALAAVLNSTYTALAIESLGRASMGEGALEWTVADARGLPVLDPRRVNVGDALVPLLHRPIGSIASECERPDRRALDDAVAPALAGARDAVCADLVEAVERRVSRPKSG